MFMRATPLTSRQCLATTATHKEWEMASPKTWPGKSPRPHWPRDLRPRLPMARRSAKGRRATESKRRRCYATLELRFAKIHFAVPSKGAMLIGTMWATPSMRIPWCVKNPSIANAVMSPFQRGGASSMSSVSGSKAHSKRSREGQLAVSRPLTWLFMLWSTTRDATTTRASQ